MILLKRVYEAPEKKDGIRILVDRVWPRGVSREQACIEEWAKDVTPSTPLRKWFGHDPAKWGLFRKRYLEELKEHKDALRKLKEKASGRRTMTLVYGARDKNHTHALILKEALEKLKPGAV